MIEQPTLFDTPAAAAPAKPLTERQRFSFDVVRSGGSGGLTADEVGAAWCAHRGKHAEDDRCQFCGISGREVLRRLRQLGHVKSRRDGTWYALHAIGEPATHSHEDSFVRPDGTRGDIPY